LPSLPPEPVVEFDVVPCVVVLVVVVVVVALVPPEPPVPPPLEVQARMLQTTAFSPSQLHVLQPSSEGNESPSP
jgi:hypothetical protein